MSEQRQTLVRFITKLPAHLKVPETPLAVPANLKRYGLSQVVNHLLGSETPVPFDFLVNGELLRKSLEQHLLDGGVTTEALLEVEYIPAVTPPKPDQTIPHPEWVSSVCCWHGHALSGSYDGIIRIWNRDGDCTTSAAAQSGAVNAVAPLPTSQGRLLLTAGQDGGVKLWHSTKQAGKETLAAVASYSGHSDSVAALAVSPSGSNFASCGWDGRMHIWLTGHSVLEAAQQAGPSSKPVPKKRRAGGDGGPADAVGTVVDQAALSLLEGHSGCVAALAWPSQDTIVSGGWDHSVRCWDAASGVNTETYNGTNAVHCVAASEGNPGVVAFGGADRALRLWDTRGGKGEGLALRSYSSHSGWIAAVAWRPESPHHVITGSHDKSLKLWDIRTAVPLATLEHHTDKVLCVAWLGAATIASGGADSQLRLYAMDSTTAN